MTNLNELSTTEAISRIREGKLSAEQLMRSYLERIDVREAEIGAWQQLNAEKCIAAASLIDSSQYKGPLCGIPVGIKDIINTCGLPAEYGTPIYKGHQPAADAACVARIKHAGGVIMGKTVTTELAYFEPGKTRNPRNIKHTPGGSSSGSAAAVADYMAPFSLGDSDSSFSYQACSLLRNSLLQILTLLV